MKFLIESFLHKRTEDLSFVQVKKEALAHIKGYKAPEEGLDIPVLTEELAQNIKTKKAEEVLTLGAIVRGMVYILGVDAEFKYKEEYIEFLYATNPHIENYIMQEAIVYGQNGKHIEGLIFLKALVLLNPKNTKALFNYALTVAKYAEDHLVSKKKAYQAFQKEAQGKLEYLLEVDDTFTLAYYHLGFIYRDKKEFVKAKLYWEKALGGDLEPELKEQVNNLLAAIEDEANYQRGYEAVLGGRGHEGLPLLLALEEKYDSWWNLLFFIGLAYRQINRFGEAIEYFQRVLEEKEDQLETMVELGLCYSGIGEYNEAIEYFQRALTLGGENSEILCNLGMTYFAMGNIEEAKFCIARSLELSPDDEITQACKQRIESVQ